MDKNTPETQGLTKLGRLTARRFENPGPDLLEAFPNRHPERDYIITFRHPEFTSLCPVTGQPDFAAITLRYVADRLCVEAKSFKLYLAAYRNHGAFMESIANRIADDLVQALAPRRLSLDGAFNVRGGTAISVRVNHLDPGLSQTRRGALLALWPEL
jgi:7-cyano-7-deazaguanine reductase